MTKAEAITEVMAEINKELGPQTVVWGSQLHYNEVPRISSGSLALDAALGGGWTVNAWHEIYGDESSGKTTIILKTIACQQAKDPNWTVFWCAAEEFVPEWARELGCDTDRIAVMQTNVLEEATNAAIRILESRTVDALVIDSLPALSPVSETEGTMDDQQVGLVARMMGKFFRKAYTAMKRSLVEADRPVTCFIVNQWRERIGIMFGDPRTTPGGRAKNYWMTSRVILSRDEWITEGERKSQRKTGITIKALTKKNKSFPPERVAVFDFYFDHNELQVPPGSYDHAKELVTLGLYYDAFKVKGSYYHLDDESWHGRAALEEQLRWDLTMQERLREAIRQYALKGRQPEEAPHSPGAAAAGTARRLTRTKK
jgi:recombination protein RecA